MPASATADTLVHRIGSGELYIETAAAIASANVADGMQAERVRGLASLTDGTGSNKERNLHTWLRNLHGHGLETYDVEFTLQGPRDEEPVGIKIPTIPLWTLLRSLHRAGALQFQVSLLGKANNLGARKFWELAKTQTWGREHPAVKDLDGARLGYVIPLALHMDGFEIFSNTEFVAISVSSMLSHNTHVFDTKFQVLKIPSDLIRTPAIKKGVMRTAAAYFTWLFNIVQRGLPPKRGWYNEEFRAGSHLRAMADAQEPIMGEYTGAFAAMKCDGKARVEAHGFSMNYGAIFCCDECLGTQPFASVLENPTLRALLITDVSENALRRLTKIDHECYMAHTDYVSPWLAIPGARKERLLWDWMHLGPIGFLRDFCGSMCISFLQEKDLGEGEPDTCLSRLWTEFRQWCKARKIGAPRHMLSLRTVGRPDGINTRTIYPELSSRFKASVVKILTCFLSEKAIEFEARRPSQHGRLRASCGYAITMFIHTMDKAPLLLTREQADLLDHHGRTYIATYAALAKRSAEARDCMWKWRPKLHNFEHLLESTRESRINPRHTGCWDDESYLGKLKRLGLKCSGQTILKTSLLRYFLYLGLRWEARRRTGQWSLPE